MAQVIAGTTPAWLEPLMEYIRTIIQRKHEQDEELADLYDKTSVQEARIRDLTARISTRDAKIAELERKLRGEDDEQDDLSSSDDTATALANELTEAHHALMHAQDEVERLQAQVAQREEEKNGFWLVFSLSITSNVLRRRLVRPRVLSPFRHGPRGVDSPDKGRIEEPALHDAPDSYGARAQTEPPYATQERQGVRGLRRGRLHTGPGAPGVCELLPRTQRVSVSRVGHHCSRGAHGGGREAVGECRTHLLLRSVGS